jgi:hypothetical protein
MTKFDFDTDSEVKKRIYLVEKFLKAVLDPEEYPSFVSDTACIYDLSTDDDEIILKRISENYSVDLSAEDLKTPVWKVVDFIEESKN